MRKLLVALMMMAPLALFAATTDTDIPDAVTAQLNGTIEGDDISISFTDEDGNVQNGADIDLVFDFPVDRDSWEITRTLTLTYSGNLEDSKTTRLSFEVSPLKHGDDVVDTSVSLASENDHILVDGDSFVMNVPAGFQNSVRIGSLSITVKKGEDQKLAAGSYNGSVVVNMNSI